MRWVDAVLGLGLSLFIFSSWISSQHTLFVNLVARCFCFSRSSPKTPQNLAILGSSISCVSCWTCSNSSWNSPFSANTSDVDVGILPWILAFVFQGLITFASFFAKGLVGPVSWTFGKGLLICEHSQTIHKYSRNCPQVKFCWVFPQTLSRGLQMFANLQKLQSTQASVIQRFSSIPKPVPNHSKNCPQVRLQKIKTQQKTWNSQRELSFSYVSGNIYWLGISPSVNAFWHHRHNEQ